MNRNRWIALAAVLLASSTPLVAQHGPPDTARLPKGLRMREAGTFDGYTLFTPLRSTKTFLINMAGEVVHQWDCDYVPGHAVYLLANGHLLRACHEPADRAFPGGGAGGRIQEMTWEGTVVWDYRFGTDEYLQHHDLEPLPNGNVLVIAWERKTREEAVAAGRNAAFLERGEMWVDWIAEIEPVRPDGGKVVWEWHAWDHLIQDRDPEKANYGVPAEHPERIDIHADHFRERPDDAELSGELEKLRELGYAGGPPDDPHGLEADWMHVNSVDYNPYLDQIVLSVHAFSEIWVIDHSTTTEQARGSTGGKGGRGGDLLYRWGNPQAYGRGTAEDRRLFAQHDARWLRDKEGKWGLLTFNNGLGRPGGQWSTVDQILLPLDGEERYVLEDAQPFGPTETRWTYVDPRRGSFFSSRLSSAQRLPNGNTLICSGDQGTFFEVTTAGDKVWEYANPFSRAVYGGPGDRGRANRPAPPPPGRPAGPHGSGQHATAVFRATRIPPNHPGLAKLPRPGGAAGGAKDE